ncbi:MAG: AhpC/TSA family protein [Myxococcota bacterium]
MNDTVDLNSFLACAVTDDAGTQALGAVVEDDGALLLVVLLRHFGCVGCSEQVTLLSPRLHELDALGVTSVFVGHGEPRHLAAFVKRHRLDEKRVRVVTNPDLSLYRAANTCHSLWSALGPRGLWGEVQGTVRGFERLAVQGDVAQQGGAFLFARRPRPECLLAFRSANTGDHAEPDDIVQRAMRHRLRRAGTDPGEEGCPYFL